MHFVVDLETLGVTGTPVILSIAATTIEPHADQHREWQIVVDPQSCLDHGMTVDGNTILWWFGQSDGARQAITSLPGEPLAVALGGLADWMLAVAKSREDIFVWSHGATFDAVILNEAYRLAGLRTPWPFRNVRDTRTLFHLAEGMTFPPKASIDRQHIAIEDARWTRDSIIAANRYIAGETNGNA